MNIRSNGEQCLMFVRAYVVGTPGRGVPLPAGMLCGYERSRKGVNHKRGMFLGKYPALQPQGGKIGCAVGH